MFAARPSHRSAPGLPRPILRPLLAAALLVMGGTLMEGSVEPAGYPVPNPEYRLPDNANELLRVDPEMIAFFSARIRRDAPLTTQLDQIANSILGETGLQFRYESKGVYDPREAFRLRRGNCLTYSMLTVAVARAFGLEARFNEVLTPPRWNRTGEIVLLCRHINVRVEDWPRAYELDLKLNDDLLASRTSSGVVDDVRAFSSAFTSAGVYRLAAGDNTEAFRLLEQATVIDPSAVSAWNNLGSALIMTGQLDRAQECFEQTLDLDPYDLAALSELARIHTAKGRLTEAQKLERTVTRYRLRNPYYLLSVAREEISKGNLETARRHLKRAISIKRDEPELYQLMAEVALGLGLEDEAKRWTQRSQRVES
jgi:tetratricopeptide (TPR) repeat protein